MTFELKTPLPSRRSAVALREQLIEHFIEMRPEAGERFLSEYELARLVGLSRPTVRRAMDELDREGWIERRNGRGTFIGPRASMPLPPRRHTVDASRRVLRMALLVHGLGDFRHDWYSPAVLSGINDAANELSLSIEVLGDYNCDVKSVSQRLMQSHPDVLACTAPGARHAMLIGESLRLDIPCVGTGTFLTDLGVPTVCEDGVAGGRWPFAISSSTGIGALDSFKPRIACRGCFTVITGTSRGWAMPGWRPTTASCCGCVRMRIIKRP